MKRNNIFDEMERETEIDMETVYKKTGASTENIRSGFNKRLEEQRGGKKHGRMRVGKVAAILAAAVAAALTVSVVAVAAEPVVNEAFADYFAGECENGVYSGSNIQTSSDKVNVEFLGVAGDDTSALMLVRLTNKDGNDFVSTFGDETYFVYDHRTENQDGFYAGRARLVSEWITGKDPDSFDVVDAEFSFSDNKTIMLRMRYAAGNGSPKGVTIGNTCNYITAVDPVSIVYTFDDDDDDKKIFVGNKNVTEDISEEFRKELNDNFADKLESGQQLCLSQDGKSVVIANVTKIELDYTLSARLDYKSSDKVSLAKDDERCSIGGAEWDIQKLDAQSFSMELSARTWNASAVSKNDGEYALYDIIGELDVTLNDGSQLKAKQADIGNIGGYGTDGTWCAVSVKYFFYNENGIVIIDPASIVKIECSGVVIAEK